MTCARLPCAWARARGVAQLSSTAEELWRELHDSTDFHDLAQAHAGA